MITHWIRQNLVGGYRLHLWIVVVSICSGCSTTNSGKKQLSRVAKDWCLAIRASQIMPVYPLTEDLLPGDVYLVRTRIDDQVRTFTDKGFLPLDQLLVRLNPEGYPRFYQHSYGIGTNTNTPYHWKFTSNQMDTNSLKNAPRAAFPSYSFEVNHVGGLNLALPIHGIPVGLNLLGAGRARADVSLDDAYTFGLDESILRPYLNHWALTNFNILEELAPIGAQTNYLRMITRVYWVGGVNISMWTAESWAGGLSVGASKPVNIPLLNSTNALTNYGTSLSNLSDVISSSAIPGGSIKVAAANNRSISLNESFPRPLAIGYLAFDIPILKNGDIGVPTATRDVLAKLKTGPADPIEYGPDDNSDRIDKWVKSNSDNRQRLRDWLTTKGIPANRITNIIYGRKYAETRQQIVEHFIINKS